MQSDQAEVLGIQTHRSGVDADRFAVDSRRRALDRLRDFLRGSQSGAVLITGEPGAGKSWLVQRLVEGLPAGWRSAGVEVTSALDGLELLRLAGDEIGLAMPDRLGAARLMLAAGLRDASADSRSWMLTIDQAQLATASAREEIHALSNRLGQSGGFAALVLLGRTELAREMAANRRHAWASLLGLHLHLPPLDLDEARDLLGLDGRVSEPALEALHRDALGNPRAILRIADAWTKASRPAGVERATASSGRPVTSFQLPRALPPRGEARTQQGPNALISSAGMESPSSAEDAAIPRPPLLIPARPPIRLEEGLVEVGWEGDLEAESTSTGTPPIDAEIGPLVDASVREELVEDRYAALQAWAEWSRNRERSAPSKGEPLTDPAETMPDDSTQPGSSPDEGPRGESGHSPIPAVRAETSHDFAPYSQLFTRLRHSL
jgi:type II secretory pathway predicted ATPase ExeA